MDFQELQTFFPSDEGLIEELGRLKLSDPSLGVQRLCERLHSRHPVNFALSSFEQAVC